MGNAGEFAPQWSMNEAVTSNSTSRFGQENNHRFKGRSSRSIDKISINSGLSSHDGSQVCPTHCFLIMLYKKLLRSVKWEYDYQSNK